MALPLQQIILNLPQGRISSLPRPPVPSNSPNVRDVAAAATLKAGIDRQLSSNVQIPDATVAEVTLYHADIVAGHQLGLAAAALPAAPGAAPAAAPAVAGSAMILAAIHAMQNTLTNRLDNIDQELKDIRRETARNGNIAKGVGEPFAYTQIAFVDGTLPTQAGLPALTTVDAIRALTRAQAGEYLEGYGQNVPPRTEDRKVAIAQYIGCSASLA